VVALSVLDLAPVPPGASAADALGATVALARAAERLGYERFWLAEHHNTPSLASSSPAVLIERVASATTTIRVGSGGVMLPNHSPLSVAESFRLLEALHPNRIDLGVGRAPGTDGLTAYALRRSEDAGSAEDFPERFLELLGFLGDGFEPAHPFAKIAVSPADVEPPEVWMLGSSDFGGRMAAHLGLGFAFAHHINASPCVETMRTYREQFCPSDRRLEPHAILAVSVVCADDDEEAERLAAPVDLAMVRLVQGRPGRGLPRADEAGRYEFSAAEDQIRRRNRARYVVGSVERVHESLSALVDATGADELMVTTMVADPGARIRTYELLAEAFSVAANNAE
jgi:luciferase family oxidoreductase group 1